MFPWLRLCVNFRILDHEDIEVPNTNEKLENTFKTDLNKSKKPKCC